MDIDASDQGIGAVLSQIQSDVEERVVAYASRLLSKSERHYCVTRKELLAVVVFLYHFRQYLLGRKFILQTDHSSLVIAPWCGYAILKNQKGSWPGVKLIVMLMLCHVCPATTVDVLPIANVILAIILSRRSHQDIRNLQTKDELIRPFLC